MAATATPARAADIDDTQIHSPWTYMYAVVKGENTERSMHLKCRQQRYQTLYNRSWKCRKQKSEQETLAAMQNFPGFLGCQFPP